MRRWKEYTIVYTIGSVVYGLLEVLWRGFTHWSMLLAGGAGMLWLYLLNVKRFSMKLWKKCLCGAAFITGVEFVSGLVLNRLLRWNVWDYSGKRGNVCGQICPQYALLWFALCAPALLLCRRLKRSFFTR